MNEHLIENCDFDEDDLASFQWESDVNPLSQNQPSLSDNNSESSSEQEEETMEDFYHGDEDMPHRRAFQMFWCSGQDDNAEADFPKPDSYGVRQRNNRMTPDARNRLLEQELFQEQAEVQYAPKRPPPLLDFAFVFTSFVAALVFAYYSAV